MIGTPHHNVLDLGTTCPIAICLVAAFLLCHCGMIAQTNRPSPVLIGLQQGIDVGLLSGTLPVYSGSLDCGEFTSGYATSPQFGTKLDLPELLGSRFGASASLGWSSTSGQFSTVPIDTQWVFNAASRKLVLLDRRYTLGFSFQTVRIDLLAHWSGERLSLSAGPSVGYRFGYSFSQTDKIDGAGGYSFQGGELERPIPGAEKFVASTLSLGALAVGAYNIPIGMSIMLAPSLSIRADLTSPVNGWRWQTFSIGAGLSLMFDLTTITEPPEAPSPKSPLTASIELFSIDRENRRQPVATIRAHDLTELSYTPMLRRIYFDSGSAMIPGRYLQRKELEPERFTLDSLRGLDLYETHHRILDILGLRLREHPGAMLTLRGKASADEPATLGETCAAAVASYLERNWGINASRITTDGSVERSESRYNHAPGPCVEIASGSPELLVSVSSSRLVQSFDPPAIRVLPKFEGGAGVRSWTITILNGERVLARYSNDQHDSLPRSQPEWNIPHRRSDSTLPPIAAELVVIDSSGTSTSARDRIPLLLERTTSGERKQQRIIWPIIAFDHDSSRIGAEGIASLRELAKQLRPEAQIAISGFISADEVPALATQRAESVGVMLRSILKAEGIDDARVTVNASSGANRPANDPAENRMLSHRVEIVAEQDSDVKEGP